MFTCYCFKQIKVKTLTGKEIEIGEEIPGPDGNSLLTYLSPEIFSCACIRT
jgi:hypothetical protein